MYIDDFPTSMAPPELVGLGMMETMTLELPLKKRKRAGDVDDTSFSGLSFSRLQQLSLPTPSPTASNADSTPLEPVFPQTTPRLSPHSAHSPFPTCSKRARLVPKPQLHRSISNTSSAASLAPTSAPSPTAACHVCHRRPQTVQDLPAYTNCHLCNARTCFICTRTCDGPRCQIPIDIPSSDTSTRDSMPQGRRICNQCCYEVGAEGTVWCHVCYVDDSELDRFGSRHSHEVLQAESVGRIADWLSDCGVVDPPGSAMAS